MPRILVDSIEFGIPESERLHPATGSFAQPHGAPQSDYAGPPHVLAGRHIVHHWRDWGGEVALALEVPAEFRDRALELAIAVRAYRFGEPPRESRPTRLRIESDAGERAAEAITIEPSDEWTLWEIALYPEKMGDSGRLTLHLDDGDNLFPDGSHYGKSLAFARLYAVDPPAESAGSRRRILLDVLDLGVTESEAEHRPFGDLALGLPGVRNHYRGPANVLPNRDLCHFREAPRMNAFYLDVPPEYRGRACEVEIALRTYRFGEPDRSPAATVVQAVGNENWVSLGAVDVPQDNRFHVFRLAVPAEVIDKGALVVWIDDRKNHQNPANHYGKAIGFVHLTAASGPRRETVSVSVPEDSADIVLVMCPIWTIYTPPVPVAALASFLDGRGVRVKVHDFNIEFYRTVGENGRALWEPCNSGCWEEAEYVDRLLRKYEHLIQRAADRILAYKPRFAGFTLAGGNWSFTKRLARILRERRPDLKIVLGGPGTATHETHRFGDDWDYLVYGAGEWPLLSLVKNGDATATGIVARNTYEPYRPRENRAVLRNLNELPLLHFRHFDLLQYEHPWALPVIFSRGCIYKCTHCFDHAYYAPYRCLDGARAVEQIRYLVQVHGRRVFHFADLLVNGNLREMRRMAEGLIEADLDVQWDSFAATRGDMSPELMELLRRSGCAVMRYGVESASPKIIKLMNRRHTLEDISRCLRRTHDAGIETHINLMVGYPGETDETIQETIDFVVAHRDVIDSVETICPVFLMPHTPMVYNRERYGIDPSIKSTERWVAGDVDFERRQAWVYHTIRALRAGGVRCEYAVIRGFDTSEDGRSAV